MIKVSVVYPATEGESFDLDYYTNKHIPMVIELCGTSCKGATIDAGIAGGAPGAPAPYACMGNLLFESVEEFQAAFGPHAGQIMGDIPNYTKIAPIIQISNVNTVLGGPPEDVSF